MDNMYKISNRHPHPHTHTHTHHQHPHNHTQHPHNHHHNNNNSHVCMVRVEHNRKLVELHRNSYKTQVKSKNRSMLEENKKFIDKLVNVPEH